MSLPHVSVLADEVLSFFEDFQLSSFVDGTLGAGGHSLLVLEAHPELKQLIGIDQDPRARQLAAERLIEHQSRVKIVPGNFSELRKHLESLQVSQVDGILLDLGVSSMQLDEADRGFSFAKDGPLDMRMDPSNDLTAEIILNEWPEARLGEIFRQYGEERRWRAAASKIVAARKNGPITSTRHLVSLLAGVIGPVKKGRSHPVTRIFQALRIAVNGELDVIKEVLPEALDLLRPGGRLAVISFHSLEDRIVKDVFREWASDKVSTSGLNGLFLDKEPLVRLLTRKPCIASNEEVDLNPRSRSARLRVIEKL